MDEIRIENLEVYAYHGVYPKENKDGQPFYINAVLYTDTQEAAEHDDLSLSTNYGEVCHFINDWMEQHICKLIETVAETLVQKILLQFPLIKGMDLEIKKPEAPIELPFDSVSVKIHRDWHQVYLSVGSNMGDKQAYIQGAISKLKEHPLIKEVKTSKLLVTKPYGDVEQEDFLNGAIGLKTLMSPKKLLELLHDMEAKADRKRELHWGPRTLDLDIIFYDKLVYEDEELILPHVDMENRYFVLKPLSELAPNMRHPILQKTVTQLLQALADRQ